MGRVERVRAAVVGCGVAAWVGHLPWWWEHPSADLIAVCDANQDRVQTAQRRYAIPVSTTSYEELLSRDDIDAISICTPPAYHASMAIAAAHAGKHVLLEKPMGRSVEECDAMLVAAQENGTILMLGHEKRFNLACEQIKRILDSGAIGKPFSMAVHWGASVKLDPERMIPAGYRENYEWRWKDASVGGGILQDHLPHYVDLWRWWTGAEVESVCAEAQNVTRDYLDRPDIGVWEDFGLVLMRFNDGTVATFETGTVGRGLSPILHNGSGIGEWSEFGYIYGTRGQIAFDLLPWDSPENGRVMVWSLENRWPENRVENRGWYQVEMPEPQRSPGGPLSPATNTNYMFRRQIDHFVRCIQEGGEPAVTGLDGRATLAVIEAVYESQRSGQKIRVEYTVPAK